MSLPQAPATHRKRWIVLAVVAVVSVHSSIARANGRFPRSERLVEDPTDPNHLLLAATYGVLTTSDRGQHWYDFCEALFAGDSMYAGDPLLELVGGGGAPLSALLDVQSAITRSADFCGWTPVLGSFGSTQNINDYAVDRAHRQTVVAVVTTIVDGGFHIALQESNDAGITWHAIGSPLPLQSVTTIDLDPTDPTHIYASGLVRTPSGQQGVLLKSLDHGATWAPLPIPNTDDSNVPYIAAIHPQDANKIFVRTDSFIQPVDSPEASANDALLYSSDGGATWKEVLRQNAKLLGFALSPDGSTVLAGYGDPVESGYYVDPTVTGVYQASLGDLSFSQRVTGSVTCLTWTSTGAYACTAVSEGGTIKELAFFANGNLGAGAPSYTMKLADVVGPPPCCRAAAAACDWSTLCVTYQFFACSDASSPPAVLCADAGMGVDAAGMGVDAAQPDAGTSPFPTGGRAACTCRNAAGRSDGAGAMFCAAGLLSAGAVRRRRCGGRDRRRAP
jgi:hypothetical protein